jgi:hypothetical protein
MAVPSSNGFVSSTFADSAFAAARLVSRYSTAHAQKDTSAMPPIGKRSKRARAEFVTATTIRTRTLMTVDARTMASAHAGASSGLSFARRENVSVTAVDDARPPTSPVTPSPRPVPRTRIAT